MKKGMKKLKLNRETLRSLSGSDLDKAAGGALNCGSLECSDSCPATNCGKTACFCPFTLSVPPAVPC